MSQPLKTILTIAGSDPSGGAGIQADLKAFTVLKVYGSAAITCLTAQNSLGVASFVEVAPEFVRQQVELVLADQQVSHVKIGMVGSGPIAEVIGQALAEFRGEIVYDPVLKASDGKALMADQGLPAIKEHLVARATVLTPNLPELAVLCGFEISNLESARRAMAALMAEYANLRAMVVKGGHLNEKGATVVDTLALADQGSGEITWQEVAHPRIETQNSHGTGCTFASAFAAFHQHSGDYTEAFTKTVELMDRLLRESASYHTGHGRGGMVHYLGGKDQTMDRLRKSL